MSATPYNDNGRIVTAPGVGECYSRGLDTLKKNFLELLLVTIVVGVFWTILWIAQEASEGEHFISPIYGMFSIGYLILILNPIRFGGLYAYLKGTRSEKPSVKDIFVFQKRYVDVVLAALLCGVIVVVGLAFLIVPGIIFACKLAFVPYLVIDRKLDAVSAVKKSWNMTKGHAGTVFLIGLLAIPIALIGLVLLGVGVILSSMWITSAVTYLYYRAASIEEAGAMPVSEEEIEIGD